MNYFDTTLERKFVAKNFKKSPNLVTLNGRVRLVGSIITSHCEAVLLIINLIKANFDRKIFSEIASGDRKKPLTRLIINLSL